MGTVLTRPCWANREVHCDRTGYCQNCGWNPDVLADRKAQLRAKLRAGEELHVSVQKRNPLEL